MSLLFDKRCSIVLTSGASSERSLARPLIPIVGRGKRTKGMNQDGTEIQLSWACVATKSTKGVGGKISATMAHAGLSRAASNSGLIRLNLLCYPKPMTSTRYLAVLLMCRVPTHKTKHTDKVVLVQAKYIGMFFCTRVVLTELC